MIHGSKSLLFDVLFCLEMAFGGKSYEPAQWAYVSLFILQCRDTRSSRSCHSHQRFFSFFFLLFFLSEIISKPTDLAVWVAEPRACMEVY